MTARSLAGAAPTFLRVAKPWRLFESRLRLRAYFSNDGRYETSYKSPLIREI